MGKQRIEFVDIAKGLGILLVVWGHSSKILFNEIYAFHMPLFFFIAGFFFRSNIPVKEFITKKVKSLIIPYFIFYTFTLLFYVLLLSLTNRSSSLQLDMIIDYIPYDNDISNTPLWFLYALFWMSLLYYLLRRFIQYEYIISGVVLLLYAINETLTVNNIILPMFMNRSIGELIYMHMGFICYNKYHLNHLTSYPLPYKIGSAALSMGVFISLFIVKSEIQYSQYILKPFIAFAGLMIVISVSLLCNKNRSLISYLGKHSLVIFSLHLPLFEISRPLAKRLFFENSIGYDIVIFTTSIVFAIIIGELLMIIFPKYIGKGIMANKIFA